MLPLLAHIYEPHRATYPCYVQPKLNGIRALYQNGRFQSREQLPFPPTLLRHLTEPLRAILGPEVILDGELYKHGWPLQRINAAVTPVRQEPTEDTLQVEYHIFDVVDFTRSFVERTGRNRVLTPGVVHGIQTVHCGTSALADTLYAKWVADGYEGMMYRLGDCPYTRPKDRECGGLHVPPTRTPFLSDKHNRCWHLLKRKDWQDDEYVCRATFEGEGKYKGMVGSLGFLTPQGKPFTVGSGLTDGQRIQYWDNPPIGQTFKVKYLVLSVEGIPLNPTII